MPRQSNGNFIQPANTAAVSITTISSTAFNTLITDIGTEITNSLDRGGRSAMTAALPMGAQKITGMADPTVATDAATKNYVDTSTAAFFSTGDGKITIKTAADSGWILCDDGTFGSATSGASNTASAATLALFTLFFNNLTDTAAPILTSGGGATTRAAQTNAASAWAANCRMTLTKQLGRAITIAGSGSGLTPRALGASGGLETASITQANLPNVNFTVVEPNGGLGHQHATPGQTASTNNTFNISGLSGGAVSQVLSGIAGTSTTLATTGITVNSGGSATAISIMQPFACWNVMIKL